MHTYLLILALVSLGFSALLGGTKGGIALAVAGAICAGYLIFFVEHGATFLLYLVTFGFPLVFGAIGFGFASGLSLRDGRKLLALALISPVVFYWAGTVAVDTHRKQEIASVLEFVKSNRDAMQAAGEGPTVHLSSEFKSKGELLTSRYEVSIRGTERVYAIVNVARSWWTPTFELACVTSKSLGQRDPFKHPCNQ